MNFKSALKKGGFLLLGLHLLSSCSTLNAKKSPAPVGFNVKKVVLDNGLTVLISPNNRLPIVSVYTLFDVGGRYESKGTTGATHFLEHMMFKGAKKYGPGEFDTLIEKNGGMTNAYTTNDATVYYESVPSGLLPTILDLEADRLQNLLLEPISFESERQVVFEERKMRYENNPDGLLYLTMMKKVFEGTPYGHSVIGEVQDLKDLSRDQMMEFFKTYYRPNNAILAIVGDVDVDKTVSLVKEVYGPILKSKNLDELKKEKDSATNYQSKAKFGTEYKVYATNPIPKFMMAYEAEKVGTRKAYVHDIISSILTGGGSSYLVQKYVKSKNPILSEISISNQNLRYSGVFYFQGELLPNNLKIEDVKKLLEKEITTICDEGMTERSLERSKNQIMTAAYHQLKSNAGVASAILNNEKLFGDYNYGVKEMEIYKSITLDEAKKECKDLFKNKKPIFISSYDKYSKNEENK